VNQLGVVVYRTMAIRSRTQVEVKSVMVSALAFLPLRASMLTLPYPRCFEGTMEATQLMPASAELPFPFRLLHLVAKP
jgi:hypothetical protein